jgi:CIC family chloride channel protein
MTGQLPAFRMSTVDTMPLTALPAVALLGIVVGVISVGWNQALVRSSGVMQSWRAVPRWAQAALLGAAAGLIAWWIPEAVGGGHATAEWVLGGGCASAALGFLALLLLVKFVLTVGSYASGAPGGIFAPMLLMGSLVGAILGRAFAAALPSLGVDAQAMAILGMAAWFAGSVRAPLTGIVLMLEMTGNYHQLFSLSVVCLAAYLVAEQLGDTPIYDALLEADLHRRGISAGEQGEARHVVFGIQHGSALDSVLIREASLPKNCLLIGLERRGKELVPHGGAKLEAGDHITVAVPSENVDAALQVVELCRGS